MNMTRFLKRSRGQSLVEFALVLPMLMILIFGVIDFGMALRSYITLTNATREGGRYAAIGNPAGAYPGDCTTLTNTTVIGRVCTGMEGLDLDEGLQIVSVTYPTGQAPGNEVVVAADYTYEYITPLGDMADFFSGGSFPDNIGLYTSTSMRLE